MLDLIIILYLQFKMDTEWIRAERQNNFISKIPGFPRAIHNGVEGSECSVTQSVYHIDGVY